MILVRKSCPNYPYEPELQMIDRLQVVKNIKDGTLCCSLSSTRCTQAKEADELRKEVANLKDIIDQYKFASESFERRVLDLQQDLRKKDEELNILKEKLKKSFPLKLADSDSREATPESRVLQLNDEPLTMRKLFVGGLPQGATERDLLHHFSQYGFVVDTMVMKDAITHKSRGFGFVIFAEAAMADVAQSARPHKILNKEVETKRAIPKSHITETAQVAPKSLIQTNRVFVGGLRSTTTNDILKRYFEMFGHVETVNVMEDSRSGRSRGFAYVTFAEADVAEKVALQKIHMIDKRRCEVKPAFSKVFKPTDDPYNNKPPSEGAPRDYSHVPEMYGGYYSGHHYDAYSYSNYKSKGLGTYNPMPLADTSGYMTPPSVCGQANQAVQASSSATEDRPTTSSICDKNNSNSFRRTLTRMMGS